MPRLEAQEPAVQAHANQFYECFRESPDDLVRAVDGFMSFDAWLFHVLNFRLRPTKAHLAVRNVLRSHHAR